MAKQMSGLDWTAFVLVIIGALNWGLIAINSSWNLVAMLPSMLATLVYALVGLSGLWLIISASMKKK